MKRLRVLSVFLMKLNALMDVKLKKKKYPLIKHMNMQKIIPNLWFDGNVEEAAAYYLSIFKDGKIIQTTYYPETKEEGQ